MKHFSAEEWSDCVRGLSPPGERDRMKEHLDSGCSECGAQMKWLSEAAEIAANEVKAEPPEEIVARARAIFAPPVSRDWIERLDAIVAELVFDSTRDLQPAGVRSIEPVRSVEAGHVRLLYRAGDYSVELMLETDDIVGQIANETNQSDDLTGAVVQIVASGEALGETETNQYGEFVMEQPEARNAVLRIALKTYGKKIDLPLRSRGKLGDSR